MRILKLFVCLGVIAVCAVAADGQQIYGASGTPANQISLPVSYGFINANSGNLHLEIPLVSKQVRGTVPFSARLVYDSASIYAVGNGAWVPVTGPNVYGGWTLRTSADAPSIGEDPRTTTYCYGSNGYPTGATVSTTGFYIYDGNGTYHHFPIGITYQTCNVSITNFSGGAAADDGSGYYMQKIIAPGGNSVKVWNRSGIQVYPSVQDTNGNGYTNDGNGNITDPAGVSALSTTTVGSTEVDYKYYDATSPGHQSTIKVGLGNITVCTDFNDGRTPYCNNTLQVVSSITYASGDVVSFGYGANGGVTSVTLPQSGVDQFTQAKLIYSGRTFHGATWSVVTNGSTITLTRPQETGETGSAKLVYTTTSLAGTQWQSQIQTYNADGSLAKTTQTTWTSTCTGGGTGCVRPTQTVTTPAGGSATTVQYGYDGNYNVTSVKQWDFGAGTTGTPLSDTETTYASLANTHILDRPDTVTISGATGWGTSGQAAQTKYSYDGNGNLTNVQRWNSDTSSLVTVNTTTYDSYGNPLTVKDALNNQTTLSYECSNSYPATVTRPNTGVAHLSSVSHDCDTGLLLSQTDENGNTTNYTYDASNRVLRATLPDGGETDTAYNSSTLTTITSKQTSTANVVSTNTLDSFGRPSQTTVTDPEGNVTVTTTYDNNGRVAAVTNPYRTTSDTTYGTTTYIHDGLDRVTKTTMADGSFSTVQFSGACATSTDPAGRSLQRCADALGHLTQVTEPNESTGVLTYVTAYSYDVLGNLLRVDQKGGAPSNWRTRTFTYNSLSQAKTMAMPESGTTTYNSYDVNGNLLQQTDARGIKTTFGYDALNRVTSKTFTDSTKPVYIHYDESSEWGVSLANGIGQVTTVYRGNPFVVGTIYSYDKVGRVVHQWDCRPSNCGSSSFSTQYSYDLAGNLSSLTYPSGRVVNYGFNAANALSSVILANAGGQAVNFTYASIASHYPDGTPSAVAYGNGVTDTVTLNNRLQRTGYKLTGTQIWLNRTYTFTNGSGKNDGNLWGITDALRSGGNQSFNYDYLNRVTSGSQSDNAFNETFGYDPWGNLTQSGTPFAPFTPTYDGNNRIVATGFNYDAAGNLTKEGTTNHAFTYDAENHMTTVDTTAATYTYAGDGLRARKDVGATHTESIYRGSTVIAEQNEAGDWTDYVMTPGGRGIKAEGLDRSLHIYGTNCSACGSQYSLFYFPSAGGYSGYTVRSGDKLFLTQYQGTGAKGGIVVAFTDGTNTSWSAKDQSGYYANDDQSQLTTHSRTIDLSSFAGKTINNIALNSESDTAAGAWLITYEQIAMVSTDGTVRPLYTGQTSSPLQAGTGSSGVTGRGSTVDFNRNKAQYPNTTTTYYYTDPVGSSRLITQGGGWPVWQGTFAPFGQEVSTQIAIDGNKFATYQHENESNLEFAQFRQYASVQGRFSTPDPYLGSANIGAPQTWNRYGYVNNSPMLNADPLGLFVHDCMWHGCGFEGVMGGGNVYVDGVRQTTSNPSGLGGGDVAPCPNNFCAGFAHITGGPEAGNVAFVQYAADANGDGAYASITTPIPDASLPTNQIYEAYKLGCQYATNPCGNNDPVLVRLVGPTYNVQLVGNPLDIGAASDDGYQDPAFSNAFFHPGANRSFYIGGFYIGLDPGHVVDGQGGLESHYDNFGPYNPAHWFLEAFPSLLFNRRSNAVAVPYTCSLSGGCRP